MKKYVGVGVVCPAMCVRHNGNVEGNSKHRGKRWKFYIFGDV